MAQNDKSIANDDFWLNLAAETIYTSYDKHIKAVENLQALIRWAFGIFTTSGAILFFFPQSTAFNIISLILFGFAFSILTIGYFFSAKAGFPDPSTFNSLVVKEIKVAHNLSILKGSKKFISAVVCTFLGFLFLAFGILVQFSFLGYSAKQCAKDVPLITLRTGLEASEDSLYIPVTVGYSKDHRLDLTITGYLKEPKTQKEKSMGMVIGKDVLYTDASGSCSRSYTVKSDTLKYFLVAVSTEIKQTETNTELRQTLAKLLTAVK